MLASKNMTWGDIQDGWKFYTLNIGKTFRGLSEKEIFAKNPDEYVFIEGSQPTEEKQDG